MLEHLIAYLAPHNCLCCNQEGSLLCEACIYQVQESQQNRCHECNKALNRGVWCQDCMAKMWCDEVWTAGLYEAPLRELIQKYKFDSVRAAVGPLSDLLSDTTPQLPPDTVVVPVPTILKHVHERGFDHVQKLAQALAKKKNLTLSQPLARKSNTIQVGANRKTRLTQAKNAFKLIKPIENRPYLIVDDVITTGATVKSATKLLKQAGASLVCIAVVANEPLNTVKHIRRHATIKQ